MGNSIPIGSETIWIVRWPGHETVVYGREWTLTYHGRVRAGARRPMSMKRMRRVIVVKVEAAGMFEDDFEITFADGSLIIGGAFELILRPRWFTIRWKSPMVSFIVEVHVPDTHRHRAVSKRLTSTASCSSRCPKTTGDSQMPTININDPATEADRPGDKRGESRGAGNSRRECRYCPSAGWWYIP